MVYARLAAGRTPEQRVELDAELGVAGWPRAGERAGEHPAPVTARPAGVPAWWRGDDDASASTMAAIAELRRRRGRGR